MDRVRPAIFIPFGVFLVVAVIAVAIGAFLHFVESSTHSMGAIAEYTTPLAALIMVVVVTAAGFIAAGGGPSEP